METRTIKQLRNKDWPIGTYPFYVYVFRVGEDALYVGESEQMEDRIWRHVTGADTSSPLLQAAIGCNEEHHDWCVDFYSADEIFLSLPGEIQRFIHHEDFRKEAIQVFGKFFRTRFERMKIYELSPAYNKAGGKSNYTQAIDVATKYYPKISDDELKDLKIGKASLQRLPLLNE